MKKIWIIFSLCFWPVHAAIADAQAISYREHDFYRERVPLALKKIFDHDFYPRFSVNTFYVPRIRVQSGCRISSQEPCTDEQSGFAVVLWVEANTLLMLEPMTDAVATAEMLAISRRHWDLSKDVVATPDDIQSSTYVIDRREAFRLIYDAMSGDKIVIERKD